MIYWCHVCQCVSDIVWCCASVSDNVNAVSILCMTGNANYSSSSWKFNSPSTLVMSDLDHRVAPPSFKFPVVPLAAGLPMTPSPHVAYISRMNESLHWTGVESLWGFCTRPTMKLEPEPEEGRWHAMPVIVTTTTTRKVYRIFNHILCLSTTWLDH